VFPGKEKEARVAELKGIVGNEIKDEIGFVFFRGLVDLCTEFTYLF
jgi:hypothetical protein